MQGILSRGEHHFASVSTAQEAWDFIHQNVKVDLVFTELQLAGPANGLALVQRLKADRLLKLLPIVIYAEHGDRDSVKRSLELHIQGFHIKPYHDDDIFAEIAKTEANPWRSQHFEEEKSFCKMMGYRPDEVHRMLDAVRQAVEGAFAPLQEHGARERSTEITALVKPLVERAEEAGAWGLVECLNGLVDSAQQGTWGELPADLAAVRFACQLIRYRLDGTIVPPGFQRGSELGDEAEARERERWKTAPADQRCPMVDWARLQQEIDGLAGVPVIDTSAASFQMMANGHPSCLNPLMDIVDRDPGLAALVLVAANKEHPAKEGENVIEDARLSVSLLGETRLESLARQIPVARSRFMELPPVLDWGRFWMFQRGVARIARFTCHYLEFYSMESLARMAGLLHDLGKVILLRLHPVGFQVLVDHARQHRVSLGETEKLFLGCTTFQIGARFAARSHLSGHYVNVMRWVDQPEAATEDRALVAIVSLARHLCQLNAVGACGEPALGAPLPLQDTPEWRVLQEHLFPSFDLQKFELSVHAACQELRNEFSGHGPTRVA